MAITKRQALEKQFKPQAVDNPDVESTSVEALTNKPGRKVRSNIEAGVQQILDGAAPYAAVLLRDHIRKVRGVKSLKPSLQRACEYIIDHAIGKSRQKIEHSGGVMTYKELAESAESLDKKPRDVLADVEEIANKYQEKR